MLWIWLAGTDSDFVVKLIDVYVPAFETEFFFIRILQFDPEFGFICDMFIPWSRYTGDHPNPEPNPKELQMGGYQQLVRCEPFRGKYRNSFEHPEPFVPNEPYAQTLQPRSF